MEKKDLEYDLLKGVSERIEKLCVSFDKNLIIQYLFLLFGVSTLVETFSQNAAENLFKKFLPESLIGFEIDPNQIEFVFPVIISIFIFKFGLISLKLLRLFAERDLLIISMIDLKEDSNLESKIDQLKFLKGAFRYESLGGLFYRIMVFKGIEISRYQEEPNHRYKYFIIILINCVVWFNSIFVLFLLFKTFLHSEYTFGLFLIISAVTIVFSFFDFFPKLNVIRSRIESEYRINFLDYLEDKDKIVNRKSLLNELKLKLPKLIKMKSLLDRWKEPKK